MEKQEKWLNLWKVRYNPTGFSTILYYFSNKDEANRFAERDFADMPVRVAASTDGGPHPVKIYKTAENAERDKGQYQYI